ncbi:MAG: hypothetical protein LBH14_04930 [Desulfobulbaceae bacterium]|nr:hypothetical protein [Desulfobulbaceae bacterium]
MTIDAWQKLLEKIIGEGWSAFLAANPVAVGDSAAIWLANFGLCLTVIMPSWRMSIWTNKQ